jgi:hypothetical protein
MTPGQIAPQDRVAGVTSAAVISLLGPALHNVADLDGSTRGLQIDRVVQARTTNIAS